MVSKFEPGLYQSLINFIGSFYLDYNEIIYIISGTYEKRKIFHTDYCDYYEIFINYVRKNKFYKMKVIIPNIQNLKKL